MINTLKIHFLNVGNGDSTIIELPDNSLMMVDIMNGRNDGTYNTQFVNPLRYLEQLPHYGSLHRYIQTHPDMDHMNGLSDLLNQYSVTNFWDTQNRRISPDVYSFGFREKDWQSYQDARNKSNVKHFMRSLDKIVYNTSQGTTEEYNYNLYALSPNEELVNMANENEEWNLLSFIVLLEYEGFKLLLSGDADDHSWNSLYDWINADSNAKELISNVSVFKAAHHGRKSSYCGSELLSIINPGYIVISHDNVPSDESAKAAYKYFLDKRGKCKIYETVNGTIVADYYDVPGRRYGINQYADNISS